MGKRRKDNDIVVSFVGGSRDEVCGSAMLISYPIKDGKHECILCDCGMVQGGKTPDIVYADNKKMVENIPVKDISAVFISHAHIDHTGNLSIFGRDEFLGEIHLDTETGVISQPLLSDSEFLHKKTVEAKGKRAKPLHTEVDLYKAIDKFTMKPRREKHILNEYVSYEYYSSGHCFGSQIKLYIKLPTGRVRTIVYTGDLGSNYNKKYKPYGEPLEYIPKANMYVFEGTYGISDKCFSRKQAEAEIRDLKKTLEKALKEGKRVFFPSFSFARTQELMTLLYTFFKDEQWFKDMDIPIYVDGKLTNKICDKYNNILKGEQLELWEQVSSWKPFNYNIKYTGTLDLLSKKRHGIYISSSGFVQPLTRSMEYVKSFMGSEKAMIIFIGYCGGEGSVGDNLIKAPIGSPVSIDNTKLIKNCEVKQYFTFSSHIQQDEIFKYWGQITAEHIIIHHASDESKAELMKKGREYLSSINSTIKLSATSKYNSQFIL